MYVSDAISFIDFEYADFNWQAYDIADHFCEFAGDKDLYVLNSINVMQTAIFILSCTSGMDDFDPTRYPSKTVQLDWLTEYLTTFKQLSGDEQKPTKDEVENLYVAVNKCAAVRPSFVVLRSRVILLFRQQTSSGEFGVSFKQSTAQLTLTTYSKAHYLCTLYVLYILQCDQDINISGSPLNVWTNSSNEALLLSHRCSS